MDKRDIQFIYWLNESPTLRGLKNCHGNHFVIKLKELKTLFDEKYPDGLTGFDLNKEPDWDLSMIF